MARIKLKSCDTCAAVTSKDDEEFHQDWHDQLDERIRTLELVVGNLFAKSKER